MIEQLFGSKTRVKLLYLFYGNPNRSFYVREITRKIDEQINSVRRELANLLSIGIIASDSANNRLYYEVNQKFEHYRALNAIFGDGEDVVDEVEPESAGEDEDGASPKPKKQVTTVSADAKKWQAVGNVTAVAYTGKLTRDDSVGVDIVIVGDVNGTKIDNLVAEMEKSEAVELRYASFTDDEAVYRKQVRDRFWGQLDTAKKQIIIDKKDIFGKE